MKNLLKVFLVLGLVAVVSGCSLFEDSYKPLPPAPLVKFTPSLRVNRVWRSYAADGTSKQYLRLTMSRNGSAVYTTSYSGLITATNSTNGKNIWQMAAKLRLTGGITASNNLLFLGTGNGQVLALHQKDGTLAWWAPISSEVLSTPVVAKNIVLVKVESGELAAYNIKTGKRLWSYSNQEPSLILRGASSPVVYGNYVVAGFASGNLAVLTLRHGQLVWQGPVSVGKGSTAVQRMVDIDATPCVKNGVIYAASYQGRIVALRLRSGRVLWRHPISSYSGMVVDSKCVYITDADGTVWAFDRNTGEVEWKVNVLLHRGLTAPAQMGNYLLVGDKEGYLHLLDKADGHFVARIKVDSSGITARPLVERNSVYVYANDGYLAKFMVN